MSSRQDKLIEQFLSDELDSDESIMYDSDADPEYIPGGNKLQSCQETSTSNTFVPVGGSDSDDDDISVEVSSSDEDCDWSDSDLWVDTEKDIPDFNFDSTLSGIKINVPESARDSPIDLFKLLWTDEIFDIIVNSTNNYFHKIKAVNRPHSKYSRKTCFNETNKDELQNFFGICLLLGSVKYSVLRDAFSNNPLYSHPLIKKTMSGRRFEQLLNCFSVEYSGLEVCDDGPMRKINPVYTLLIQNFQKAIYPDISLSLDESLLLHCGRLGFRQYIKGKKAKYGIKFYELCTPDGYVLNIDMYNGKNDSISQVPCQTSKIDSLVLKLMSPYLGKEHSLYMNNYYNSVMLSNVLLNKQTHITGTLRNNRKGNPKEVVNKKLKKGEHV